MDDRTLLEKAAKAAGIDLYVWGTKGAENFADMSTKARWNPLTDDGDALRLAVKLQLNVEYCRRWNGARAISNPDNGLAKEHWANNESMDPYAATRLAIVRAAAAMADKEGG